MYDKLILQLDLCILAYQLYSQSLLWPTDPYYEQLLKHRKDDTTRRQQFTAEVLRTFSDPAARTVQPPNANAVYHGPGACMGWAQTNATLDPIISAYDRINPWQPCFVRPLRHRDPWLVYNAPSEITSRIGKVYVASYKQGPYEANTDELKTDPNNVDLKELTALQPPPAARDWLYCFEGGTGADPTRSSDKRYAAWSLMGFVLVRHRAAPSQDYDVHIVFRGSRSGKLRPFEAGAKKGNPDWVTDLMLIDRDPKTEPVISDWGTVVLGFAESLKRTLPAIMKCLADIHTRKKRGPKRIYVSGHSLGGALACDFAAAVTLGITYWYGDNPGKGEMPADVRNWPWDSMKVTTFGSPAVGNASFRSNLDEDVHCTRVWILADPITVPVPKGTFFAGHVGTSLCLTPPPTDPLSPGDRHDPGTIRRYLAQEYEKEKSGNHNMAYTPPATADPQNDPARPWAYFPNCSGMLAHLTSLPNYAPAQAFKDFIPNLAAYLQILGVVLSGRSSPAAKQAGGELPSIIRTLNRHQMYDGVTMYYQDMQSAWSAANNLHTYDARLHEYVGLCLYLATCTKGQPGQFYLSQPTQGPLTTALGLR